MKYKIISVVMMAWALACPSAAIAGTQTGTVSQIIIRSTDGLVYFFLDGPSEARPDCANRMRYWMIKDENSSAGKRQLAALMLARSTGQQITVAGTGTCTRWTDGEDVDVIYL